MTSFSFIFHLSRLRGEGWMVEGVSGGEVRTIKTIADKVEHVVFQKESGP